MPASPTTEPPAAAHGAGRRHHGVGEAIAKAAKEGDFFGIGGKQVKAAESAVLVEIKTVLGL